MSAFYFGDSEAPLFGFYHGPSGRPVRRAGVVICNPMGQEYLRSHRSLKGLAERLSGLGYHVLRFDYHGTGDSAGGGEEIALGRWADDACQAVEELKAMSGVRTVGVIGVRLGAVVAATTASRRDDVTDIALWDPVVDGGDYLGALLGGREEPATRAGTSNGSAPDDDAPSPAPGGFPLPAAFRREVAGVDLTTLADLPVRRALLVSSDEKPGYAEVEKRLRALVPEVRRAHRPGAEGWDNPGRMGSVVLVPAVMGTITDFFKEADQCTRS
jgi:pimeloyl-ACP methyl ester carboxylesterase